MYLICASYRSGDATNSTHFRKRAARISEFYRIVILYCETILCTSYGMAVQCFRNRWFHDEAHFLKNIYTGDCDTIMDVYHSEHFQCAHTTNVKPFLIGHGACDETLFIQLCDAFFDFSIPWTILKDWKRKPFKRTRQQNLKEVSEPVSWLNENSTPERYTEKHGTWHDDETNEGFETAGSQCMYSISIPRVC